LLGWITTSAQEECGFKLKKAEKLYEEGAVETIPVLLDSCLKTGFLAEEKIRAYKLLIQIYLYEDRKADAENCMTSLLKYAPEYQLTATDPAEFVNLYDQYRTSPLYSMGGIVGVNIPQINVLEYYGVNNLNENRGTYSASGAGFQAGLRFNRYLIDKFELNLELVYRQTQYQFQKQQFGFSELQYTENQAKIEMPLMVTMGFRRKGFSPIVRLGASVGYLLKAEGQAVRNYISGAKPNITGSVLDRLDDRNRLDINAIFATGIRYRIKTGFLIFDLRYNLALLNQVKATQRFEDQNLSFKYFYVDNDYRLSNISLNLGYVYSFYVPKKKKQYNQ